MTFQMVKIKFYCTITSTKDYFLGYSLATSSIFIQKITVMTKLTRYRNVRDQINKIEKLRIKLKYDVYDTYQIRSI